MLFDLQAKQFLDMSGGLDIERRLFSLFKEDTKEVPSQPEFLVLGHAYVGPKQYDNFFPPLAWVCPAHRNVFLHEVAHLFGCSHTIEQHIKDGGEVTNNNYGYYMAETNMATIMAIPTEANETWISFFSSKDKTYYGVPLGDDKHDNRNQIMKTRFLVSQYGDESGSCKNPK